MSRSIACHYFPCTKPRLLLTVLFFLTLYQLYSLSIQKEKFSDHRDLHSIWNHLSIYQERLSFLGLWNRNAEHNSLNLFKKQNRVIKISLSQCPKFIKLIPYHLFNMHLDFIWINSRARLQIRYKKPINLYHDKYNRKCQIAK